MKANVKFYIIALLISSLIALTSAQNRYRNQRASTNRNRSSNRNRGNSEPVEQGRTLGLLSPLLNLGLNSLARPYVGVVGYDAPIVAAAPYRPPSQSSGSAQSDPYYGGYNQNYYPGYFGGYPIYRPIAFGGYPIPIFGGYRPPIYPVNYGYPQYNGYGGQRPVYSNPRPNPIAQRPNPVSQPAINTPSPATIRPPTASGTSTPQINSAQAAQVANLLGQLLGQQLRPLLNPGAAAAPAHDVPGIEPAKLEDKRYRSRNYRN